MDGTSLVRFKSAYIDKLTSRLPNVSYEPPLTDEDVNGIDGSRQVVWFDGAAQNTTEVLVFKGAPHWFDETYNVTLILQALGKDTDDTQAAMDQAAVDMLGEAIAILASDPTVGLVNDSNIQVFTALPAGWKLAAGTLPPNLNGARFELDIQVKARLTLVAS